jgi:hemerythrin-like domain-containing protein
MAQFRNAPIDRHEALAPFSRDHYTGLVQVQRLRKAADADAVARRQAVAEFIDAWDQEIAQHFDDEERVLLDLLTEADRSRLVEEHARIRGMASQARLLRKHADPDADTLRTISRTLDAHIRWEEREVFGRVQLALDHEQLEALQARTAMIEHARTRNTCRDTRPASRQPRSIDR